MLRAVTVPIVMPSTPYVSTPCELVPWAYTLSMRMLRTFTARSPPWLSMRTPSPLETRMSIRPRMRLLTLRMKMPYTGVPVRARLRTSTSVVPRE